MQIPLPSIALSLVSLLAGHGLRKRSLSPSGAAAAFAVGYTMMSVRLSAFSVALIVFYLTGSRATKFGKALKQQECLHRGCVEAVPSLEPPIDALSWLPVPGNILVATKPD
ncbi:hypothetical protein LXA43DRAFT_1129445 [Ganoderma leucocontextum]|nr:hypothetical protein LXA43DRAFT_1129445 [Ganoderma leucocontextum]